MPGNVSSPLLDLIRSQGLLDDLQLEEVMEEHNRSGKPFPEILQDLDHRLAGAFVLPGDFFVLQVVNEILLLDERQEWT